MNIQLKYGGGYLGVNLPDSAHVDVFEPQDVRALADPVAAMHEALDTPLGCLPLEGRPRPASVAIAVPDETRPFPIKTMVPALLDRLFTAWPDLKSEDVVLVVGGGLHPAADEAQLKRILPDDLRGIRVVAHDAHASPVIRFGVTERGTPVEINAEYGKAELKIVMGMVDTHQFVGFTGGAKGVVIGCASAAMIEANHTMLRDPRAVAGNIEDNPVRQDLNEAGDIAGVSLAVNVVMDPAKQVVAVMAGLPPLVMREASRRTGELYGLPFSEPYDLVLASCGGTPKDICLYQAQKGLNPAMQCARPGAVIVLAAECGQGIGDEAYHDYVRQFSNDKELMAAFEAGPFRMGAHKAYLLARTTTRYQVYIHSAMSDPLLRECLLTPGRIQDVANNVLKARPDARVAVLKSANSSYLFQG